jgi:hypothetical protein
MALHFKNLKFIEQHRKLGLAIQSQMPRTREAGTLTLLNDLAGFSYAHDRKFGE